MQGQLQDTEGVAVANLAVRLGRREAVVASAARACHELADSVRVGLSLRVLEREALVVVVVAVQHHVGLGRIQVLPEGVEARVVAVDAARSEARLVPIREDALGGSVRGQIALEE